MIVRRNMGNVECDIDVSQANEIYFSEDFAKRIVKTGISGILSALYEFNGSEHLPLSAFIEMTDACNFSCPFCYINENRNTHNKIPSFDEIKNDLDFLINNGLLFCTLSGGECLIHPDFEKIYRYLKENGVLVSIFTNAYLIEERHIDLFSKLNPFNVEISIYGSDDASYRKAVNRKDVVAKKVFDNILALKNIGIKVICKTPITNLTENSYPFIKKWCENNEIQYYNGIEVLKSYSGIDKSQYKASDEICSMFKEKSNELFFNNEEMMKIGYDTPSKKRSFDCSAGRYDIFITSQYKLLPCMKAINVDEWSFDISKYGMQYAYNLLKNKISNVKNKPLKYCVGCRHNKVCQECFMTQYEYKDLKIHRQEYCLRLKMFMNKK